MIDDEMMMTEDEPQRLHPMTPPAETLAVEEVPPTVQEAEEVAESSPVDEGASPDSGGDEQVPATPAEEAPEPPAPEELPPLAPPVVEPVERPELASPALASAPPPSPEAARRQYWRSVLTGSAETVPDAVRARASLKDASLSDEQSEYRLLSTINRSWAVDNLGVSREQVRAGWARLRSELARRFKVADDEQELFAALSVEAEEAPRRERMKALYETHYRAALLGQEVPVQEAEPGAEELPGAQELATEARQQGESVRRRYLPLARDVAKGLDVFAGLEEEAFPAPRVLAAVPEFARSVDALAEMDDDSRQLVYTLAQSEFRAKYPKGDASLYRTMLRAARRGATGMGLGVGQALANATVASLSSVGSLLGENWGAPLREGAQALDRRARIAEEARRLLYEEVRPLDISAEAGLASQLMVDVAGAVPAALVACGGGAGFATLGISGMGEAVAAARQRAPEGSQWLQYLAGVVGGGIQASIYSGMSRVGGQLLSNAIGRFARASGKGARGYTLASLGALAAIGLEDAKLLFAGKSAEAAGLAAQELASRLERTASNIDWKEYGDNAQDVELNLREAAMALPFILIASGRVALRHFRSRDAVLGDGHALRQWGIDETTRDAIMKERDINRQGDMLRDALRSSRRWSAPGFLAEAARALRLLNTDYYDGFKEPQAVVDFLRLPSQGSLAPRTPIEYYSYENPEHVDFLRKRHGSGVKVNNARLGIALQLWDEWWQKSHLIPTPSDKSEWAGKPLPTSARRKHFGRELMRYGSMLPARVRPGGFYAPRAEAERLAMLRDRVAEIHDLSYQMLLASFPLDALSHSTRALGHLRQAGEQGRVSMLEAVGRSVLRRATGVSAGEALQELGQAVTNYFWRRRYTRFPPGWMNAVPSPYTKKLDEYATGTFSQELADAPLELRNAYRIALGLKSCAAYLYELLPITPDFQTSLARGLSPIEAYVHLLSRELGVDIAKARDVEEMLAPFGRRATDMREFRLRNEANFELYRALTGCELESARGDETGAVHWRVRRPNGRYTHWHRYRGDAINDMVANAAFTFMPFSYDRAAPLLTLHPEKGYDLNTVGKSGAWQFTGYDHLCRLALRDAARSWVESAPYAQPGFELGMLRRYVYLGGRRPQTGVLMREGGQKDSHSMLVDSYTLSSPLRLAQARFRTYWWRQLASGLVSAEKAGEELVKLRVISPEELERVKDIAKPLAMPRNKDVPLKLTPPPDIPGMNRAMAAHLTDFSMRYFLAHLDDMPLPSSAREWFRLAPLCPLEPGKLPARPQRISMKHDSEYLTCLHNRVAARELCELAPAVAGLRRVEREGLLINSPLVEGLRNAVGLNRAMNLEQAWCMHQAGGEAMMAASQPFWRAMEKPVEGWKAMDASEREALRRHVESICRTELSPEAMEAEARGESPDYVLHGLQNLQDVLADYPRLHQYGLEVREGLPLVRQLTLEEPFQDGDPLAEPEYEPAPLYMGGSLQGGFRMGPPAEVPEFLQGDSRVLPALHLLGALRSYPGSRPYLRREGIQWKGELYGGPWGRHPRGLEQDWRQESPLRDMIDVLRTIDEMKAGQPKGKSLLHLGMELPGLGEELDMASLANVTLYRHWENPHQLCRLMPGEPDAANPSARAPYVVQSVVGITMDGRKGLRREEEMHRGYTPLERFRPYKIRLGLEGSMEDYCRNALRYTVSEALSGAATVASAQDNPRSGISSLRELLLRFAEDSGFSCSLRGADPMTLSEGQVRTLRLARELLLCVCGSAPAEAYERFQRMAARLRCDDEARDSVLRTLFASAGSLYQRGSERFRPAAVRSRLKKRRILKPMVTEEDRRFLHEWESRNPREKVVEDVDEPDGYNDEVRADGYSKGFFDD